MIPDLEAPPRSVLSPPTEAPPLAASDVVFAGSGRGLAEVSAGVADALAAVLTAPRPHGPLPSGAPRDVLTTVSDALGPATLPASGIGSTAALRRVASVLVEHGVDLTHPMAAAHLQPPVLPVAVAADALAAAGNASVDTYDSGPSAIAVERWLVHALTELAGFGSRADGVLTPGGSLSNLIGLLLARDAAASRLGIDVRRAGVGGLHRPVVLCSELAHFSVHRACAALGLGEDAVRPVPVDHRRRMRPDVLARMLHELTPTGRREPSGGPGPAGTAIAVVATAGTTDFGTVDPLPEIAEIAAEHAVWMHVDAAYGFGALFSERLAPLLAGLELADSVTLDLHKIGWQPAAASVLLVSDASAFTALEREVAYLNPADDIATGYGGLLGHSLQTTRRPDAVKIVTTLLAHGRRGLGDMLERCHDLARHAERRIAAEPDLELVAGAELTTVVFRHRGAHGRGEVNAALRRRLAESGTALIGRTEVSDRPATPEPRSGPSPARTCLKFTLLNPAATADDIDALIDAVLAAGRDLAREDV